MSTEFQAELPGMPADAQAVIHDAQVLAMARDLVDRIQRIDISDENRVKAVHAICEEFGRLLLDPNYGE